MGMPNTQEQPFRAPSSFSRSAIPILSHGPILFVIRVEERRRGGERGIGKRKMINKNKGKNLDKVIIFGY